MFKNLLSTTTTIAIIVFSFHFVIRQISSIIEFSNFDPIYLILRIYQIIVDLFLNSFWRLHKNVLNICWNFRRGLKKQHLKFISKLFSLFITHLPLIFEILFVTDQNQRHLRISIDLAFLMPRVDVLKGPSVSNVVDYQSNSRWSIVSSSNWLKIFLSCSVPNLQLDSRVVF